MAKEIEFVPVDPDDEWFMIEDGSGTKIEGDFDNYGIALVTRYELLDSGEFEEVNIVRKSDAF
jgi:hypothetical protein